MTEDSNGVITPAVAQQIQHASEALSDTIKTLMDSGMEPPALATALSGQFINFIVLVSAIQRIPKEQMMDRIVESVQTMQGFAFERYDQLRAEIDAAILKEGGNEQQ